MTSSITRQKILCHTFLELHHRIICFNTIDAQYISWRLLSDALKSAAEAIRIQAEDYSDALNYEEEAARQAEAEYRKEKDAEETDPIF